LFKKNSRRDGGQQIGGFIEKYLADIDFTNADRKTDLTADDFFFYV